MKGKLIKMNLFITLCMSSTDLLSSSEFCKINPPAKTSSKNQPTGQWRPSELFSKELAQTDKRSYDSACSKRLQNPFHFAAKGIKATKFGSLNQRSIRPSGSVGPGHVDEGCHSSFGFQRGPVSQLVVSC